MVLIKIRNKKLSAFVRISLIPSIIILGFSLSCSEKRLTFEEQFNLKRFKVRHFDLYNPILNTYKLDPSKQKELDCFYRYDVYFDHNDICGKLTVIDSEILIEKSAILVICKIEDDRKKAQLLSDLEWQIREIRKKLGEF